MILAAGQYLTGTCEAVSPDLPAPVLMDYLADYRGARQPRSLAPPSAIPGAPREQGSARRQHSHGSYGAACPTP